MTTRQLKKAKTAASNATSEQQPQQQQPDTVPVPAPAPNASAPSLPAKDIVQNLSGIPLHLVKYIFDEQWGYQGDWYYANHIPYAPTSIGEAMPELAMVSKGWFKVISQIVKEFEASDSFFYFKNGSEQELTAFYAKMEQRGSQLTNLRLLFYFDSRHLRVTLTHQLESLTHVDAMQIDWDRAFRHLPKLLRLDLGSMQLHSTQLGAVLAAASTHCPLVQSLILPTSELNVINQYRLQPNLAQLYTAMERWYKGSLNRGLLQLTVPHRLDPKDNEDLSFVRYTDEYLNAIAAHCPNLEYLDGGRVTNRSVHRNYSEEMLFCSLDAWENFCRSCTKLRDFDWFCAPLDDRFLEVFGKYPKPQLTRMTLACGSEANWPYDWHSGKYLDAKGFKFSAKSLGVMLAACPALSQVYIQISNLSRRLKEVKNGFSDDFLVALAQHCKRLTDFRIDEYQSKDRTDKPPARVGDKGLGALATLPHLCSVTYLDAPQATAQGVFDLLVKTPHARDRRDYSLTFGEPRTRDGGAFFELVSDLLEKFVVSLPAATLPSECSFHATLTILFKFTVKNHDAVKKRLESCAEKFSRQFPHYKLRFLSASALGSKNVPDDLTEIYCVTIDTRGEKRWGSRSWTQEKKTQVY